MDEPLGALDLKLRDAMQFELRRIQRELKITTVYVTHDQVEAMSLSDRIAVMNFGRVIQAGTPEEIYDRPRTQFVAHFVGRINFVPGRVVGHEGAWAVVEASGNRLYIPREAISAMGRQVTIAIRPERVRLAKPGAAVAGRNAMVGTVAGRRFVGNLVYLLVKVGDNLSFTVELHPNECLISAGETVQVTWIPDEASILEEAEGEDRSGREAHPASSE
jgi:spermidine/putrescine transport system ATP-binding protein